MLLNKNLNSHIINFTLRIFKVYKFSNLQSLLEVGYKTLSETNACSKKESHPINDNIILDVAKHFYFNKNLF